MSLTGDTFDFQQGNVVTSSAQMVDSAATVGDVLTVQADKSIAAASGGGSLPSEWTVAADGGLTQAISDVDGSNVLRVAALPGCAVNAGVIDNGDGTGDATLSVTGVGGGGGGSLSKVSVANGSAAGTGATMDGEGALNLFTRTTRKGIEAWDDQGNVLNFALLPAGQMMTGALAAPVDGALAAGQLAFWFDDSNGAAKLMLKGKSADGTVVTGTVNLA